MHTVVIESDRAFARLQELADREGKNIATVVVDLVEEKLETTSPKTRQDDLAERLIALSARTAELWTDHTPHGDLLYDEDGLPK